MLRCDCSIQNEDTVCNTILSFVFVVFCWCSKIISIYKTSFPLPIQSYCDILHTIIKISL